jgi:hypothetical protein
MRRIAPACGLLFAAFLGAQANAPAAIACVGACTSAEIAHADAMTLLDAVLQARCKPDASLEAVVLVRFNVDLLVMRTDVKAMIKTGKTTDNYCLNAGDILFVPRREEVKDKDIVDVALQAIAASKLDASRRAQIAGYRLLHGRNVEAQQQLAMQLGQMGKEAAAAVPDLVKAMAFDPLVAREAATALGMIGPAAKEAVPALQALAAAKDVQLRARCGGAAADRGGAHRGEGRPLRFTTESPSTRPKECTCRGSSDPAD